MLLLALLKLDAQKTDVLLELKWGLIAPRNSPICAAEKAWATVARTSIVR